MDDPICDTYDETLMNLLVENKTLINFFISIFGFLSRKTDFYMTRNEYDKESVGFPPGVAEELVVRILRKCDPFNTIDADMKFKTCPASEYVPNMVAEEVEIETSDFETHSKFNQCTETTVSYQSNDREESEILTKQNNSNSSQLEDLKNVESMENLSINCTKTINNRQSQDGSNVCEEKYEPEPIRSEEIEKFNSAESQKDSETYNGAKREHYSWSQRIGELDVTVSLPLSVKSSKQIKVNITSSVFSINYQENDTWHCIIQDNLSHRIKSGETLWVMSEGKLRIHLEKRDERWWTSLLENEPKIDTSRIDCSRPLDELPEEHIAKVRELQWNQMQKLAGKATSEEIQKRKILQNAWNMEGSPFANTPFDPNILQ